MNNNNYSFNNKLKYQNLHFQTKIIKIYMKEIELNGSTDQIWHE